MIYRTHGVCSSEIHLDIENGVINAVHFTAGCTGNLEGLCRLVTGMNVSDVIHKMKGIRCGSKQSSCPDQLANALEYWQQHHSS